MFKKRLYPKGKDWTYVYLFIKYGIPDKDRTCVYPLGGDCSSTELRGQKPRYLGIIL